MLHKALDFLVKQLAKAVSSAGGQASVVLTSIVNEKGELNIHAGQLSLTVVNIEEERFLKVQPQREKRTGDQVQFANPEIKLNVLVMLAANPGTGNYADALERLSEAITFFQGTSFFEKSNPGYQREFPAEIEQLSVELYSLTLEQQNQLWASLGAKYIPSAVYKVRLVVIDRVLFDDKQPVIKAIDNNLKKIG